MKKVSGFIFTVAMMVLFTGQIIAQSATTASTDDKAVKQTATTTQTCGKFVDNNKDGICDNRTENCHKEGKEMNFTDANKDGVCDHKTDGTAGNCGHQCGKGNGSNCGKGTGPKHHGCTNHCGAQVNPEKK